MASIISKQYICTDSILVVEDNQAALEYFSFILEDLKTNFKSNFTFDLVKSAEAAVELIKTKKYDKIISDYKLKDSDGLEVLKFAKQNGIQQRILITAVSEPINLKDNVVTFAVRKPLSPRRIGELILNDYNDGINNEIF